MAKNETDPKPPRFMVVLVDFKTDTQRQVGAAELDDIFDRKKKTVSSDFQKFITYFKKLVADAEKDPWAVKATKTTEVVEGEVVNGKN